MALLHEDLIEVMPAVEEANSISEELDKRVKFEIILIAPNKLGSLKGKADGFDKKHLKSSQPEVCVKMKNLENGTEFIWPKEKFLNRLYLMKEMYNNYEEEDDDWDLPEEKDPFQEDLNQEICIGTAQVFLQPIGKSKFQFFVFWHFSPIFVLLKLTCLVTLFDRKLQVFKNSLKWTIFGMFN